MPDLRPCSRLCREAPSSSADDADYADRVGITSGSTCIYGAVPRPCVPSCEGSIIGQRGGVAALDDRTERTSVLAVSKGLIERTALPSVSVFRPLALDQN